ncbi:MAG: hypothetical protein M0R03_08780 [Novosphingobium sp.]|nr:hypothetical protein [Novosphingobium sp.]
MDQYNKSLHIKNLWKNGHYKNRDTSYITDEWKQNVSDIMKKRWKDGVFTKERNQKISIANKGRVSTSTKGKRDYSHTCIFCKEVFITKTQHRSVCNKDDCKKLRWSNCKINPVIEKQRRIKISKALKGKIPKNLLSNINKSNSPPQIMVYNIVKNYFNDAKFNYCVKTEKTKRFLDIAIPSIMVDIEYNGKVHLMKCVKFKDKRRTSELTKIGWNIIIIDRHNMSETKNIIEQLYVMGIN